jgi:hypothetical protein
MSTGQEMPPGVPEPAEGASSSNQFLLLDPRTNSVSSAHLPSANHGSSTSTPTVPSPYIPNDEHVNPTKPIKLFDFKGWTPPPEHNVATVSITKFHPRVEPFLMAKMDFYKSTLRKVTVPIITFHLLREVPFITTYDFASAPLDLNFATIPEFERLCLFWLGVRIYNLMSKHAGGWELDEGEQESITDALAATRGKQRLIPLSVIYRRRWALEFDRRLRGRWEAYVATWKKDHPGDDHERYMPFVSFVSNVLIHR